jgi:hypothetical protein
MTIPAGSLLFVDSNVLIEALFVPASPASLVIKIVATGAFKIATCKPVIRDVENAILKKLSKDPDRLDIVLEEWQNIQSRTKLKIFPAPPANFVEKTYLDFISSMRHSPDIIVLAAAILAKPAAILSGNWEHFNNTVATKCGIPIFSCAEFMQALATN